MIRATFDFAATLHQYCKIKSEILDETFCTFLVTLDETLNNQTTFCKRLGGRKWTPQTSSLLICRSVAVTFAEIRGGRQETFYAISMLRREEQEEVGF